MPHSVVQIAVQWEVLEELLTSENKLDFLLNCKVNM